MMVCSNPLERKTIESDLQHSKRIENKEKHVEDQPQKCSKNKAHDTLPSKEPPSVEEEREIKKHWRWMSTRLCDFISTYH